MAKRKFDLGACYALAWKSFAKWWIPLCLISAAILGFKFVPRLLARESRSRLMENVKQITEAANRQDQAAVDEGLNRLSQDAQAFTQDLIKYTLMLTPVAFILWSILLLFANRAVKDKKEKRSPGRVLLVAWWRLLLVVFKMLPAFVYAATVGVMSLRKERFAEMTVEQMTGFAVTFVLITFAVGVISMIWLSYTYTKLYFVPLLMYEKKMGGFAAFKASWQQTSGYFWWMFLLIVINFFIQGALSATIIGAIPGLSFIETVRAAAFRMTLPEDDEAMAAVESAEAGKATCEDGPTDEGEEDGHEAAG